MPSGCAYNGDMLDAQPLPKTYSGDLWRDRLAQTLVIGYQAAALLVYLAIPVLALSWIQGAKPLLVRWPFWDQTGLLFIPYSLGLICLGASLWVLRARSRDAAGRAFAVFATSLAICLGALFDLYTTQRLLSIWTLALALTGGALFNMGLVFPEEMAAARAQRHMALVGLSSSPRTGAARPIGHPVFCRPRRPFHRLAL